MLYEMVNIPLILTETSSFPQIEIVIGWDPIMLPEVMAAKNFLLNGTPSKLLINRVELTILIQ